MMKEKKIKVLRNLIDPSNNEMMIMNTFICAKEKKNY